MGMLTEPIDAACRNSPTAGVSTASARPSPMARRIHTGSILSVALSPTGRVFTSVTYTPS
ncbi:hypothetical protein D3C79_1093140 [compost metagenome]